MHNLTFEYRMMKSCKFLDLQQYCYHVCLSIPENILICFTSEYRIYYEVGLRMYTVLICSILQSGTCNVTQNLFIANSVQLFAG